MLWPHACWKCADVEFLQKRLRSMLTDMTFLEAFHRTKRLLNVTVTPADTNEPPRVLNHLTAPHVVIWSAVAASSAFPGLFPPQSILARDPDGHFVGYVGGYFMVTNAPFTPLHCSPCNLLLLVVLWPKEDQMSHKSPCMFAPALHSAF
jgi:predicted acylesterase/phospholipase RssA